MSGDKSREEFVVYEIPITMRGDWEDLQGHACIYVRCGNFEKSHRKGIVYRATFAPRAIFTRFALDVVTEPETRPIRTLDDLKGTHDLYYAGRFQTEEECDDQLEVAFENYRQELQYQIEERIATAIQDPANYANTPAELIKDAIMLNFVTPLIAATRENKPGYSKQIQTAFRAFSKGYPHRQDIGELCAAITLGHAELAGSYLNKIISLKNEEYGTTAVAHKKILELRKAS
jgi:hypothetical protein